MQVPQLLKKLTNHLIGKSQDDSYNDVIRQAAKIGGSLFGEVPKNHNRQFFCLDEDTWVWHDEWRDEAGKTHVDNFQYRINGNQVVKVFPNGSIHHLKDQEMINFYQAIDLYSKIIPLQLSKQQQ